MLVNLIVVAKKLLLVDETMHEYNLSVVTNSQGNNHFFVQKLSITEGGQHKLPKLPTVSDK